MTFYVLAGRATETNVALVSAIRRLGVESTLLRPEQARWRVRHGARVLNGVGTLLAAHDKLATALRLARRGLRHPRTVHVDDGVEPALEPPVVLKPRFGSWGRDVVLCETPADLAQALRRLRRKSWFRRHGVLVQELIPPAGYDVRVLVARGRVIGAVERHAAPGEWRTNITLGGTRRPTTPSAAVCETAVAAAEAIGGDLVGVDLLPTADGGYVVLELNGAVDFTAEYSLGGGDVFADAATALASASLSCASA